MLQITPITYQPDSQVFFDQLYDLPYACWLDSANATSQYSRYDIISALPATRLVTQHGCTAIYQRSTDNPFNDALCESTTRNPFNVLRDQIHQLDTIKNTDLPFTGGAIGYFGYSLNHSHFNLPPNKDRKGPFADMHIGIYHWALIQDHSECQAYLISLPECCQRVREIVDKRLNAQKLTVIQPFSSALIQSINASVTKQQYQHCFQQIQEYILSGDCYQINFAQRFSARYTGDSYPVYRHLRRIMASPFSAYLRLDKQYILSFSPERFLQVNQDKVLTQPIKGTMPRHQDQREDDKNKQSLTNSHKNRAENLMIVDLLRNDLGKHCIPGSIEVTTLCELESFPNVHHLVSSIVGQLRKTSDAIDLLEGCFPGGSITGAPKKRAMEIIEALETDDRQVYCGSIGYLSTNQKMDTNIAIRTMSCAQEELHCWGGGGIVADSKKDEEYDESISKISKILKNIHENFNF